MLLMKFQKPSCRRDEAMETVGPAQGEKKAHLHISLGSTCG